MILNFLKNPFKAIKKSSEEIENYERKIAKLLAKKEFKKAEFKVEELIKKFEDFKKLFNSNKENYEKVSTKNVNDLNEAIKELDVLFNSFKENFDNFLKTFDENNFKNLIGLVNKKLSVIKNIKDICEELNELRKIERIEEKQNTVTYFKNVLGSETFRRQLNDKKLMTKELRKKLNRILVNISNKEWRDKNSESYNTTDLIGLFPKERGKVLKIMYFVDSDDVKICEIFTDHNKYDRAIRNKNRKDYYDFKEICALPT